jgi:predicted metal-binding membrane protein
MVALTQRRLIARGEAVLGTLLLALAAVAWLVTADRMGGMDAGPGTGLGTLGFFLALWVVMMAAMMFPSVLPMVVVYDRVSRERERTPLFVAGYLITWTLAGLVAYGLFAAGRALFGDALAWDSAGRYVAGGVLVVAAAYQLTPLKNRCLTRCRGPLRFVLEAWRDGRRGAVRMGMAQGAWCVGCCWALMASLFALGVMSLAWMAFVAALIALEKLAPWRVAANPIAVGLLAIGLGVALAPSDVPALTVPGSPGSHASMMRMQSGGGTMKPRAMSGEGGSMPGGTATRDALGAAAPHRNRSNPHTPRGIRAAGRARLPPRTASGRGARSRFGRPGSWHGRRLRDGSP